MAKLPKEPPRSEITPEALYLKRREFLKNAALFAGTASGIGGGLLWLTRGGPPDLRRGPRPAVAESSEETRPIPRRRRHVAEGPDDRLPGENSAVLEWPYVEGLRLDEALHPLAFIAVGLYGRKLPNQNGAPLRLVVPWKYGFKGIKSIVKIRFTEEQPPTTWSRAKPDE